MSNSEALLFLRNVINGRLETELKGNKVEIRNYNFSNSGNTRLNKFIHENQLSTPEIIILLLALVPHIDPGFFRSVISYYLPNGGDFPEFGGVKGKNHRGILPTGETVLYVLAGMDVEKRAEISRFFEEDHLFARKNVLYLERPDHGEPKMSGRLILDEEYVDLFVSGKISKPQLSSDFPAQRITTELEWTDLVLQEKTLAGIKEIETWLKYSDELLTSWKMHGKIKPGFRVLFHGPPGTGKTLTASLLGKYTGRDVYRIDLSMVVSKYIGETEKNLSKLFDKAANKDWILFFDEADSIFGKRTNVRDAHDKYANQEVSYLLQRIEMHAGLVILASNMKSNIDSSFTRRFNSIIEFENPDTAERVQLWKNYLPCGIKLGKNINLQEIARKYHLTGANIVNVIQFAGLQTLEKKSQTILADDLLKGIQKEYEKEGKMMRLE
ncbi:MAG: ATP-binding protein [Mariniphaga sp.]|jgi:AAA+ superfamily predicted ATPase|nr:ATP-binding protein [Mariniphaga sp.]